MAREERARAAFSPVVEQDVNAIALGPGANSTINNLQDSGMQRSNPNSSQYNSLTFA